MNRGIGPGRDGTIELVKSEVAAAAPGTVRVRDAQQADGPRPALTPDAWAGFPPYASEQ
ncbi:DUF397 domain-containing protein [Streptomyces sp. NPDC057245]|uniref:DUF397 domain-containing protein n=1 Tax=Streptomyces TaxID=1883 RepID=UPI0020A64C6F|nr:DUF397 domain-containing protein [Streptomyces sp. A108]